MSLSSCDIDQRTVVVTGFGPFENHPTNASWEAVKELTKLDIEKDLNISLKTREIPVAYDSVSEELRHIWEDPKPTLVVHVGVSSLANCLTLETKARTSGYKNLDVNGACAPEPARDGPCDEKKTEINVLKIKDEMKRCIGFNDHGCDVTVSKDAGLFLCEYIFSRSLLQQTRNTMFVHVPDLNIYSAAKTAKGLYDIIRLALAELKESDNYL